MPGNMSFMLTVEQYRNQAKTVTCRNGWAFAQAGLVVIFTMRIKG